MTVQLGHQSDPSHLIHEPSDRRLLDPDLIDHQNNLQSIEALPIRVLLMLLGLINCCPTSCFCKLLPAYRLTCIPLVEHQSDSYYDTVSKNVFDF
jgi:hypothetical protein